MSDNQRRGVLRNKSTGEVVAGDAWLAKGWMGQFLGLMGIRNVPRDFALGLPGCDRVHTIGVRVPIDVIYCDSAGRVLRIVTDLPTGRIAPGAPGAHIAWEMGGDQVAGRVHVGDILILAPE